MESAKAVTQLGSSSSTLGRAIGFALEGAPITASTGGEAAFMGAVSLGTHTVASKRYADDIDTLAMASLTAWLEESRALDASIHKARLLELDRSARARKVQALFQASRSPTDATRVEKKQAKLRATEEALSALTSECHRSATTLMPHVTAVLPAVVGSCMRGATLCMRQVSTPSFIECRPLPPSPGPSLPIAECRSQGPGHPTRCNGARPQHS